jgi:polyisoprenyl-phosphate glycosyltransferase
MDRATPRVTIVVPCYNEEAVLPDTASRLVEVLDGLAASGRAADGSGICFVDDGSTDGTWAIVERLAASDPRCRGLKLSQNRGHQHALLAGLLTAPGDVLISIDADLQDDASAMHGMVDAYRAGAEIVYGVRRAREADTWFKRATAEGYYRILGLMGVSVVFNHADYRLMSRQAVTALAEYREVNLFLRGLVPQLGFNTATVFYDRVARAAGESKYSVRKMLALAFDGITSFSAVPLTLITAIGVGVTAIGLLVAARAAWLALGTPAPVPAWMPTATVVCLVGGLQMLCLGIIGLYLSKIYRETKARPRFTIEKHV